MPAIASGSTIAPKTSPPAGAASSPVSTATATPAPSPASRSIASPPPPMPIGPSTIRCGSANKYLPCCRRERDQQNPTCVPYSTQQRLRLRRRIGAGDGALRAGAHIAQHNSASSNLLRAEDDRQRNALIFGEGQLRRELLRLRIHFSADASSAQVPRQREGMSEGLAREERDQCLGRCRWLLVGILLAQRVKDAFEAEGDADAGQVASGELADEPVVATAAAQAAKLHISQHCLEDGAGVIAQPAHQRHVEAHP